MFYCGIDVAKRKHAVAILNEAGQAQKPVFEVENTQAGLGFLVDIGQFALNLENPSDWTWEYNEAYIKWFLENGKIYIPAMPDDPVSVFQEEVDLILGMGYKIINGWVIK